MFRSSLFDDFDNLFNSLLNNDPFVMKGKTKKENGKDDMGNWSKETFTSEDGMIQFTTIFRSGKGESVTNETSDISKLKKQLQLAVDQQEFEKAVELRDKIKYMEENQDKISLLESKLKTSWYPKYCKQSHSFVGLKFSGTFY